MSSGRFMGLRRWLCRRLDHRWYMLAPDDGTRVGDLRTCLRCHRQEEIKPVRGGKLRWRVIRP